MIKGLVFTAAAILLIGANSHAEKISGKITSASGVFDHQENGFTPTTCSIEAGRDFDDTFSARIELNSDQQSAEVFYQIYVRGLGEVSDLAKKQPVDYYDIGFGQSGSGIRFKDSVLSLQEKHAAKTVQTPFNGPTIGPLMSGPIVMEVKTDTTIVNVVGNQLKFRVYRGYIIAPGWRGRLISEATCTLDKPLY